MATYAKISEDMVAVGQPTTYFIGSDRYAGEITEITYYKSGSLKGYVKTVTASSGGSFRPYLVPRSEGGYRVSWRHAPKDWWATLGIGFAEDYLDPSF